MSIELIAKELGESLVQSEIQGYAEGYYGRCLSWPARAQILDQLEHLSLNTYLYAPKDDPQHRLYWRMPYGACWNDQFSQFCAKARKQGIRVVAGVAPGLDFDFAHLPGGDDFAALLDKCCGLLRSGADAIALLLDDIDANFADRCGPFDSEGMAHASLANALLETLTFREARPIQLWLAPRVYADELIDNASHYLPDLINTLNTSVSVLYCGSDVVAENVSLNEQRAGQKNHLIDWSRHQRIVWDNLYANDYCPRRLFLGPWQGRDSVVHVVLNATGLVYTDCLLLELMATELRQRNPSNTVAQRASEYLLWLHVLKKHGVPEVFEVVAPWLYHPVFNTQHRALKAPRLDNLDVVFEVLEHCLWRWKHPLALEWYPYLHGLKHDLLILQNKMPQSRIRKTQTIALSKALTTRP